MSVDFNISNCSKKTSSNLFGLCDDTPPPYNPAYICEDVSNKSEWIGEVKNPNSIEVTFIAVDNCIEILRDNGEVESKCDCILEFNKTIVFIELKDRLGRGWLAKAREQIIITYTHYMNNSDLSKFNSLKAHIVSKKRTF